MFDKFRIKPIKKESIENLMPIDFYVGHNSKYIGKIHWQIFKNFIREKQRGKMKHMVTFLDDRDIATWNFPEYWPTFIKNVGVHIMYVENEMKYSETCAPAFLNYFGVDTAFNSLCQNEEEERIYSVNFLKPNEKLFLLSDIYSEEFNFWYEDEPMYATYIFRRALNLLSLKYNSNDNIRAFKENDELKGKAKELVDTFVMSMLIRIYILGDIDFSSSNSGLIVNEKTNEIKNAPNFDYEHSFQKNRFFESGTRLMELKKYYSDVYEIFLNKVKSLNKKKPFSPLREYQSLVRSATKNREMISKFEDVLKFNIEKVLEIDFNHSKENAELSGAVLKQLN